MRILGSPLCHSCLPIQDVTIDDKLVSERACSSSAKIQIVFEITTRAVVKFDRLSLLSSLSFFGSELEALQARSSGARLLVVDASIGYPHL